MNDLKPNNHMSSKYIRYCFSLLFTVGMVAAACLAGNMEIIFPEVLALLLGAWVADPMPWRVNRIQFAALMPAVAAVGVLLVRYLRIPSWEADGPGTVWLRMVMAYLTVAVLLLIGRSTLLPAISAGILPVLMGTDTWIYPVSVAVMAVLIMIGQIGMERFRIRGERRSAERITEEAPDRGAGMFDAARQRKQWLGACPFMMVLAGAALFSGFRFLAAPPLMVALVTFTGQNAPAGKQAVKSWVMLSGCGLIGAVCRWLLCERLGLSFIVCAFAAAALVLLFVDRTGIIFPPAGALAILPILIPSDMLLTYPLMIAAGAAFSILVGKVVAGCIDRAETSEEQPGLGVSG